MSCWAGCQPSIFVLPEACLADSCSAVILDEASSGSCRVCTGKVSHWCLWVMLQVGHNALGAGQVIDQGASLVDKALESGSFFEGEPAIQNGFW